MTGNPRSMASLAGPVLTVEPSNICSSRDKLGTTVVSTIGKMQQSPILGQRVGRQTKKVKEAGELRGPGRPTRATPPPDSDSDASEVEGGVAQLSATLFASPRNFQKRETRLCYPHLDAGISRRNTPARVEILDFLKR